MVSHLVKTPFRPATLPRGRRYPTSSIMSKGLPFNMLRRLATRKHNEYSRKFKNRSHRRIANNATAHLRKTGIIGKNQAVNVILTGNTTMKNMTKSRGKKPYPPATRHTSRISKKPKNLYKTNTTAEKQHKAELAAREAARIARLKAEKAAKPVNELAALMEGLEF